MGHVADPWEVVKGPVWVIDSPPYGPARYVLHTITHVRSSMKRTLIAAVLLAFGALGAGSALADPGPNGHNDYGLCQAYFAGGDNGQEQKRSRGPFPALVAEAGDYNGDGQTNEDDVAAYCADQTPGGK